MKNVSHNAFIKDFARARSAPKNFVRAATHGKSLGGVASECGHGTALTNDMFQASTSSRGVKEAFNPKGPSGS